MSPGVTISFEEFLAQVPEDRQSAVQQVWYAVRAAVPADYTEHISAKFLEFRAGKEVYLALANQKNYMSLYLMALYVFPALREQLVAAAPKLKSGKSCLSFKRVDELPLELLADIIGAVSAEAYLAKIAEVRAAPPGTFAC